MKFVDGMIDNKDISFIKNYNWLHIFKRNNSPFMDGFLRVGPVIAKKKDPYREIMKYFLLLNYDVYIAQDEFDDLKAKSIKLAKRNKFFLKKYFTTVIGNCKKYVEYCNNLSKKKFTNLTNKELDKYYSSYCAKTADITLYLWPPQGCEDYIVEQIKSKLRKYKIANESNKIIQTMITSSDYSIQQERYSKILTLAVLYKAKKINLNNLKVKKIFDKYKWADDHGINFIGITLIDFKNIIIKESKSNPGNKIANLKKESDKLNKAKREMAYKYGFDRDILDLFSLAASLPSVRFYRLNVLVEAAYILQNNLFQEICRRVGLNKVSLAFFWEIHEALVSGKKIKDVSERKKGYGLLVQSGLAKTISHIDAELYKKLVEGDSKPGIKEISGSIANMGHAKGIVKVVNSAKEIYKVRRGDILVTHMTMPDYVPAMKKSIAIITDEGGISCHAAIVARELNKPCIIGTKIATKVLKDGMMVDVDANNGIVKILK